MLAGNTPVANRPRILQVSHWPLFDLGGVGKVVQWLICDLAKDFRVSVAAPDAQTPDMPSEIASCLENRISIPQGPWSAASRDKFLDDVREGHYDLLHFQGSAHAFDAHLPWRSPLHRLETPWIMTNHAAPSLTAGLFSPGYPAPLKALKTALAWVSECFLLARTRQEVFVSNENLGNILPWFPWSKSKMRTIYPSGLQGAPPPSAFSPEVTTIANLGHIAWRKGQYDLLKAFIPVKRKFPRLKLVLAGPHLEGECVAAIGREIAAQHLEDSVLLPGGLTDKTAFWRETDIYVQPSHYEGAPMSLMEALWMGKPAVGTRVSGIPEIIQDGVCGLLVDSHKPKEMAVAIERLIVEPETRRRFSEKSASHIQAAGMTRPQMSGSYVALYNEILGRKF